MGLRKVIDLIKAKCKYICLWIAQRIPLQNKVVFCNYLGKGFAGDPKYIALAMIGQSPKTKLYWMTKDVSIELPAGITPIKYGSFIAKWHLHTAKVWIYNYKNAFKVRKRIGQFYLQTWHGPFPFKKAEKEVEAYLPEKYLKETKEDSKMIDLMYSNNEFIKKVFEQSFWYNGEVIRSGSPHLSVLLNASKELRKRILSLYEIDEESKIVLYEPTFRNSPQAESFRFNYKRVLSALNTRFGDQFVLFIRLHPNNAFLSKELDSPNVINVTDYTDNDELMAISDVMITDFSTVAFEFALKQNPVFIFAKDFDQYLSEERGLYIAEDDFPFSIAKDEDTLCRNIMDFDYSVFGDSVNRYYNRIGLEEDGNGAEYLASIIRQRCGLK